MNKDGPTTQEAIAVVGISFGFPGAKSSDAFWELLMSKRNVSQDFPKSRLNIDQIYHPDPSRRGQVLFDSSSSPCFTALTLILIHHIHCFLPFWHWVHYIQICKGKITY